MLATPSNTNPTRILHPENPHKLSGPLQGQKSLFRVALRPASGSGDTSTSEKPADKIYHARRPHRKSRAGCANADPRPCQCDETKPHCLRCRKHGVECTYEASKVRTVSRGGPDIASPDASAFSMAVIAVSSEIDRLLDVKSRDGRFSASLWALQHFSAATSPTVSEGLPQRIMRCKMIQLAFENPLLMHGIIATAASHLRHCVPNNTHYKLLEAHHWQRSISQYSKELSAGVGPRNMDPLFSNCLLMTVHSFNLETYNPRSSFVFSDDPDALNWLQVQSGLRHLLGFAHPWLTSSMWWEMFKIPREENPLYDDHRPGREGLHPLLADICDIDDTTTEETNPYLWPLRMLTPILTLERSIKSLTQFTNFMGRLLPDYMEKLAQKDPPALVILSWWLALMYSTNLWWAETRALSECTAICMYLEDSDDTRILELLEFPAETIGYLLPHVQDRIASLL
ncbi:conserved hypothetical protein [Aspergillus terreus NIH2624]|uniref:Zn(2)-C6 fungal-type domain-containing protein n=1 Tax=Aspergillus terreus (strain NIH 2624 / FGSC A1156) TaxID=341663 RepID=Q0CRG6_ASPTN|nr:uncharacterized protein ATEG_03718 [Aspergillus terreus NIH2624]EAU35520.1 conserved hypothetical protein [Aspergillus terreus NIH2624]